MGTVDVAFLVEVKSSREGAVLTLGAIPDEDVWREIPFSLNESLHRRPRKRTTVLPRIAVTVASYQRNVVPPHGRLTQRRIAQWHGDQPLAPLTACCVFWV